MHIWHYSDNSAQVLFYVRSSVICIMCSSEVTNIKNKQTKKASYLIPFYCFAHFVQNKIKLQ